MGRFLSGRRLFGLLAAIILLVILAGVSLRSRLQQLSWPEQILHDVQSAVSGALYQPAYQVRTFFQRVSDLQTMYGENAALQRLVNQDAGLRVEIRLLERENAVLKNMVHYKVQSSSYRLIATKVTGRSPFSWDATLTLGAGSADGVKRDMPVLSSSGALVGKIVAVAKGSSTVVLLTSTESSDGVSATIVAKGQRPFGIVTGGSTSGTLLMQFISQLAAGAKVGATVVTSGLSNIYPRGIPIGTVKSFVSDGTGITRSAILQPIANMNDLGHVFILAPQPSQVNPK